MGSDYNSGLSTDAGDNERRIARLVAELGAVVGQIDSIITLGLAGDPERYSQALARMVNEERRLHAQIRATYREQISTHPPPWLAQLPDTDRQILGQLSVFYLPFDPADVAALCALPEQDAELLCERFFGAHLLSQDEMSGQYELEQAIWQPAQGLLSEDAWRSMHSSLAGYYLREAKLDLRAPLVRLESLFQAAIIEGFAPEAVLALIDHLEEAQRWQDMLAMARLCFLLYDPANADGWLHVYARALGVAHTILSEERHWESIVLNYLGVLQRDHGYYKAAACSLLACVAICQALGDRSDEAAALANLGQLAERQGEIDQAFLYQEAALAIARSADNRRSAAVILTDLGHLAIVRGQEARAWDYYEQSLELRRALGDLSGSALVLAYMGRLALRQDLPERAAGYLEESLRLHRLGNNAPEIAATLLSLGSVYQANGDVPAAHAAYSEALELSRLHGLSALQLTVLLQLGNLAAGLGEYRVAFTWYNDATITAANLEDSQSGYYRSLRDEMARRMQESPPPERG